MKPPLPLMIRVMPPVRKGRYRVDDPLGWVYTVATFEWVIVRVTGGATLADAEAICI